MGIFYRSDVRIHFCQRQDAWRTIFDSPEPQNARLPDPWNEKLNHLEKILVLRVLRPDKVVPAVQSFVSGNFTFAFVENVPQLQLQRIVLIINSNVSVISVLGTFQEVQFHVDYFFTR